MADSSFAASVLDEMIKSNELTGSDSWIELADALRNEANFEKAADAYAKALELGVTRKSRRQRAMRGLLDCELAIED